MEHDDPQPAQGWHAPGEAPAVLWDTDAPLPAALSEAIQRRLPAAPQPADDAADAPPAGPAAQAPAVAECALEYTECCQALGDRAGLKAIEPHLAALVRNCEDLAGTDAPAELLPLIHRLRGSWVAVLYELGRYAQGWAQAAELPPTSAARLPASASRELWIIQALLALETGRYAQAESALATVEGLGAPGDPPARLDWQLALGRADLARTRGHDQAAIEAYQALDLPGAPTWVQLCGLLGQARAWIACGHADRAAPLVDAARALATGTWDTGQVDLAAAELALLAGQPDLAAEHAGSARQAFAGELGDDCAAAAVATLLAGQAAYARGAYADAAGLIGAATPALRAAYGPAHPHLVQAAMTQGFLDGIRGDTDSLIRHLSAATQAAGPLAESSPVAAIGADLLECALELARGRAGRARAAAVDALELARSALDAAHPLTATCYDTVAECERAQGRWSVARVYSDLALALRQSLFGAAHPLTATSWEQLGHIAADSRDYPAARDAFELAVRIRQVALGGTHPLSATAQFALAQTYVALGDLTRAQAEAVAALSGLERTHGTLHPHSRAARALLGQFSSPLRRRWWIVRARLRRVHVPL